MLIKITVLAWPTVKCKRAAKCDHLTFLIARRMGSCLLHEVIDIYYLFPISYIHAPEMLLLSISFNQTLDGDWTHTHICNTIKSTKINKINSHPSQSYYARKYRDGLKSPNIPTFVIVIKAYHISSIFGTLSFRCFN